MLIIRHPPKKQSSQWWLCLAAFGFLISFTVVSSAQKAPQQWSAEQSRVERYSDTQRQVSEPSRNSRIDVKTVSAGEVPVPSVSPFVLKSVEVQGSTVFREPDISGAYSEFVGTTVTGTEIVAIANRITSFYREAGYHLSRAIVPPQNLASGALRIDVVEGVIDDVSLAGNGPDQFGVLDMLRPITLDRPSILKNLERRLFLVNDRPGLRITDTSLEEIGSASGHFRLVVTVESWRLYWMQGIDNYNSSAVGPLQAYTTASFNSSLLKGDTFGVTASTVPDDVRELAFGKVFYDAPVGVDGARFGATAFQSVVKPGDARRFQKDTTRTTGYELRGSIIPVQTRESSLSITVAAGYMDAVEQDNTSLYYSDKIRTISFTADYKLKDDFQGWNNFVVTLRQGLGTLGATHSNDSVSSRFDGSGEFTALNASYSRLQKFSDEWSAKIAVTSQLSANPLLLSQQYFLGGAAFGPGYYSGDNGVGGTFEFRYDKEMSFDYLKGYQLYSFVDGGQVWDVRDGVRSSLASVGIGARLFHSNQFQSGFSIAAPIQNRFGSAELSDFRMLFSLVNTFKNCQTFNSTSCS